LQWGKSAYRIRINNIAPVESTKSIGAIQQIVDLQNHKERASLRLACKILRHEIEIFYNEALALLKKKHRLDDTFA